MKKKKNPYRVFTHTPGDPTSYTYTNLFEGYRDEVWLLMGNMNMISYETRCLLMLLHKLNVRPM